MSAVPNGLGSTATSFIAQYDLAYQVSPIILQYGIASTVQGGLLPIQNLTGPAPKSLDEAFARYLPMPGSTLIDQAIGMYPFANQAVAANATIQQPLTLSMLMIAPVNQPGGYQTKLQTFSSLQQALKQHNASGGTYIVATPAFIYYDLLLVKMTDASPEVSSEDNKQVQILFQLDFIQPVLSLTAAAAVQSTLLRKITNGTKINGQPGWSGDQAASPANLPGVPGALGNAFGAVGAG